MTLSYIAMVKDKAHYSSQKDVYALCSRHGKWENIKSVTILLPHKEVFYGH
jgi:hypothetical protein